MRIEIFNRLMSTFLSIKYFQKISACCILLRHEAASICTNHQYHYYQYQYSLIPTSININTSQYSDLVAADTYQYQHFNTNISILYWYCDIPNSIVFFPFVHFLIRTLQKWRNHFSDNWEDCISGFSFFIRVNYYLTETMMIFKNVEIAPALGKIYIYLVHKYHFFLRSFRFSRCWWIIVDRIITYLILSSLFCHVIWHLIHPLLSPSSHRDLWTHQ